MTSAPPPFEPKGNAVEAPTTANGEVLLSAFIAHLQKVLAAEGDRPVVIAGEHPHPPYLTATETLPGYEYCGTYTDQSASAVVVMIDMA